MEEIDEILKRDDLSTEERERFEKVQSMISGSLTSTWLPADWGSRSVLVLFFIVGGIGLLQGYYYYLFAWLIMLVFSPRFVAIILNKFGSQK